MQGHRESVVLSHEYSNAAPGNDPNAAGNHRQEHDASSGSQFETDCKPSTSTCTGCTSGTGSRLWKKSCAVLDDLVRQGKVLYVGISDAPAWWVAQANTLAELRGWTQFIGLQLEYSLIERTVERELIPMAKALNLGVLAFSRPGGWISNGKYHGEGKPDGGRMTNEGVKAFYPEREQRAASMISAVKSVSDKTGRSMAQVALAWLRHRTVPVIRS